MTDDTAPKRILFFAEAASLAHVTRPLVLAKAFPAPEWEIHFATDQAFEFCLTGLRSERHALRCIPPATFLRRLELGQPLYSQEELERYVADDLALIDHVKPDVVAGDFRLSLGVSARLRAVPYLAICNAHWSPQVGTKRLPLPDNPVQGFLGHRLTEWVFNRFQPLILSRHTRPMNGVRKRHGMSPIRDIRNLYTDGDWTLYADTPTLVPTRNLPPNSRYIGPIVWSPEAPLPSWWDSIPSGKPVIYLTLGSTGNVGLVPRALAAFADLDVTVVVATAGRLDLMPLPGNAYCERYLPGSKAAERADVVICNGGSATAYQALAAGTPVIGVCSNLDQHLTAEYIANAGAGIKLAAATTTAEILTSATLQVLREPGFSAQAGRIAADFESYDTAANFLEIAREATRVGSANTRTSHRA